MGLQEYIQKLNRISAGLKKSKKIVTARKHWIRNHANDLHLVVSRDNSI